MQVVFIYIVCNDSGLNVSGLGRTLHLMGSYRTSIPTTHWMQESMLQCPWLVPRNDGNLLSLVQDHGWADSVGFDAELSI